MSGFIGFLMIGLVVFSVLSRAFKNSKVNGSRAASVAQPVEKATEAVQNPKKPAEAARPVSRMDACQRAAGAGESIAPNRSKVTAAQMRRAVVMSEILSKPVSLREDHRW